MAAMKQSLHHSWFLISIPVVMAIAVYFGGLDSPFVYDDVIVVVENPAIRTFTEPRELFLQDRFRPLVNLSYAIDYSFWQLDPRGYHVTNLALHLAMVLLVGALTRCAVVDQAKGLREPSHPHRIAATASAMFAVHPLLTEAVVYISGRSELLCGSMLIGALLCWRQSIRPSSSRSKRGWAWLSLLCFGASLGAKELGAMFPFLALAYDRLLIADTGLEARRRLLRWHLPLISMVTVAGMVRVGSFIVMESDRLPRPIGTNLAMQTGIIWRYLFLIVFPHEQSIAYPSQVPERVVDVMTVLASVALIVTIVALLTSIRRRSPLVSFGGLWFLVLMAPSSSVIPLNELMAEHRVYVAAVGLALSVAWVLSRVRAKWPRTAAAELVVVTGLCLLTIARVEVWSSPRALWLDATVHQPKAWRAHHGLAEAAVGEGDCEVAIPAYRRALELQPPRAVPSRNLGICLAETGHLAQAAKVFETILGHDPKSLGALNNLGRLALLTGRGELALVYFRRATESDPTHARSLTNLIVVLDAQGGDEDELGELCVRLGRLVADEDRPEVCRTLAAQLPATPLRSVQGGGQHTADFSDHRV